MSNYKVPIITVSDYKLSEIHWKQLQLGLVNSLANKNRDLQKNLEANLETVASQSPSFVDRNKLEDFYESFWAYTDVFTKSVHATKD